MFFDSHAHLNFKVFQNDYQKIINSCLKEKIWLINVGAEFSTSQRAAEIAEQYKEGVWAAVGLHPNDAKKENFDKEKYLDLIRNSSKIIAIGETGLDYFRIKNNEPEIKEKQKDVFKKQIELALSLDRPLIIHCRDAHEDTVNILNSYSLIHNSKLNGVIHCFSGNSKEAEQYLKIGFCLGFTGIITYTGSYDEIIRRMPPEKILIETDCPYLAPVPERGKRNEPAFVKHTAQKIAEILGWTLETTAEQTFQNARQLFRI